MTKPSPLFSLSSLRSSLSECHSGRSDRARRVRLPRRILTRRVLSLLCALLILFSLTTAAFAVEETANAEEAAEALSGAVISIHTEKDFLKFAENCAVDLYSAGKTFSLEADLDLSEEAFSPAPWFGGTFLGNGHRISGLRFEKDGSRQGLFRIVSEGAVIQDLEVSGTITPGGTASLIGGIAGVNRGSIKGCSFDGTVAGIENVGGIVGHNEASGSVHGCRFSGSVQAEHQSGGIAGKNDGILSGCSSTGEVNTVLVTPSQQSVEGFLNRRFDLSQISQDDFVNLTNLGGIAGENTGILEECSNSGPVGYRSTGYNVGGVTGKSSGFVSGCSNSADVNGRRDVGGIVGQLIPYSDLDFTSGKLDALSAQIAVLNGQIAAMTGSAQLYSDSIHSELSNLQAYTADFTDALGGVAEIALENDYRVLDSINIDPDTGEIVFAYPDFANADTSALQYALGNMYAESALFLDLARDATGSLATDLRNIGNQINSVFNTLLSTVSGLADVNVEVDDLSEAEAYTRNTGAVACCRNSGAALGDANCGGIVGTAAFEIEFDMEDRLDASSLLTSESKRKLFAAIRDCSSTGEVEARSASAGGIAGNMDLGVITGCIVTGSVSAGSGDYVGGLAGSTAGSVLNSWSRCLLHGGKYIGGVAGMGGKITDCRAWTHFESANEYAGAVAGWTEDPVSGNLYVSISPGGIDGITISGQTDALSEAEFLALEDVPPQFGSVTVRYRKDGSIVGEETVPFGGTVSDIPSVSNLDGKYWRWDLDPQERLFTSLTVDGDYYAPKTTLSSSEDPPRLLVEGQFYDGQKLLLTPLSLPVQLDPVLSAYTVRVNGYEGDLTVRMLTDTDGTVSVVEEDGKQTPIPSTRDGSYVVFRLENGGSFCYTQRDNNSGYTSLQLDRSLLLAAVIGGFVLLLFVIFLISRHRRRKAAGKAGGNASGKTED